MKTALVTLAMLFAGSVASAQDWTGGYIGVAVGSGSGEVGVPPSGLDTLDSGTIYGLHAGYNLQRNNLVYGAEIAFNSGDINSAAFPTQGIELLMDLKGRFGYAAGGGMVYGVLGYSTNEAFVRSGTSDGSGISLGIGYDYQFNDAFTIGGEFLSRQMQNDATAAVREVEPDVSTFTLRAGMKF